jgi:predicted amino acid dehydrogenase
MNMPKFAFMIHPRNAQDLGRRVGKMLRMGEKWGMRLTPNTLLEKTVLKNLKGRLGFTICASEIDIWGKASGYLIAILLTGRQMRDFPELAYRRTMEALHFAADELGVNRIGLGAYTAPMTGNGINAAREFNKFGKQCAITHGDSLSGYSAIPAIQETARLRGLSIEDLNIAVVGSYGVVGRPVSLLASELNPKSLILTGPNECKLNKIAKEVKSHSPNVEVFTSLDNNLIGVADIIVPCTTATGTIITPEILKKDAIVVDMAQPVNMGEEVCRARPDVLRVDGGYMSTPGINLKFSMGPPRGSTFACLAETIVSTVVGDTEHRVGKVDLDYAKYIARQGERLGIQLAPLTNFSRDLFQKEKEVQRGAEATEGKLKLAEKFASFL